MDQPEHPPQSVEFETIEINLPPIILDHLQRSGAAIAAAVVEAFLSDRTHSLFDARRRIEDEWAEWGDQVYDALSTPRRGDDTARRMRQLKLGGSRP